MLALLVLPVLPPAGFYTQNNSQLNNRNGHQESYKNMSENGSYLYTFPFPMENHYVWSKNIILFAPKLACEHVITSIACGNRHPCSIFVCHFGVYFQENWKIIFKIWPPKIAKNRLSSHRRNYTHWQSFSMILRKFLAVCLQNDLKLLKLPEESEVSSSVYRSDCSHFFQIKMHFMFLLISY